MAELATETDLEEHAHRHEKIRFRRKEIVSLRSLPSGEADGSGVSFEAPRRLLSRTGRWIGGIGLAVVLLVFAVGLALNAGFGEQRIKAAVDQQLGALLDRDIEAVFARPRFSFDGLSRIAIEVSDASIAEAGGRTIAHAEELRFALSWPALFTGNLVLSGASASEAAVDLRAIGGASVEGGVRNADGLIDPDRVVKNAFMAFGGVIGGLRRAGADRIRLSDVTLTYGDKENESVRVGAMRLEREFNRLDIDGDFSAAGGSYRVAGEAEFDESVPASDRFDLAVDYAGGVVAPGVTTGASTVKFAGSRSGGEDRITVSAEIDGFAYALDADTTGNGAVAVDAELVEGSGKIEFRRLHAEIGQNRFDFHGAASPDPATAGGDAPGYRYEFVSDGSTLAPADSSEPSLDIVARVAGLWSPSIATFSANEIGVRTKAGEVTGTASLTTAKDQAAALYLAIKASDLPVSHAKQLWPAGAATTARAWVLENLFGGTVTDGSLELRLKPGRIGAHHLTGDEVTGRFRVAGARFDIAGDLPPMRDAIGQIDFAGSDVHITLDSGTAFLPSGKAVRAENGAFDIPATHEDIVVGKLRIDVSGSADAVAELSSYKPINALKDIPFTPDDLSGSVSGEVKADIPLSDVPADYKSEFTVSLDYRDLSVAKEFGGQKITAATGRIVVDADKAVIDAKARLNGIPSEIALVEPVGGSRVGRTQKITLIVDEKVQKEMAPGLSSIVDGPVEVEVTSAEGGKRRARANVTKARIDLPWVGWSKGAGIAGEATFAIDTGKDGVTRISDFVLKGKSYEIAGALSVSGDALVAADFDRVKLNAADNVSVTVKRSGKSYDVRIKGKSLDGRSLIKKVLSDPVEAGATIGSTPVSVTAEVGSVLGFNDERLAGLSVTYSGTGKMVGKLAIDATSAGGGTVKIVNNSEGKARNVRMSSSDAGALLRFLDIYGKMRGGSITLAVAGGLTGALRGEIDARDFEVVNEPRLKSLVSSKPQNDTPSLSEAVKKDIDVSVVKFERGYAKVTKGRGLLELANGILRGPLIGFTFQGTFYDPNDRMAMTGTMMPAYGINRIFAEIPLVGLILGNGDDKGLLGITFKLEGKAGDPKLTVNPISIIAPGIFRSIFEFH